MKNLLFLFILLSLTACNRKTASLPKAVAPKLVNDLSFEDEVLKSDKLTIVDFYADWCGPCKQFEPSYMSLAADFSGQVKFTTIDYDQNEFTAYQYQVYGLPSILFFKNGEEVYRTTGLTTREHLRMKIQQFM